MKPVTVTRLAEMKASGERIAAMTAYDASFAQLLEQAGVEILLVGDSLGMVLHGAETTLGVSVGDIIYHSRCVRRGTENAMIVADMPFMSYASPAQALGNAARMLAEGGAQMVKIEGGAWLAATVRLLDERGIPVCAHLGLQPQSVNKIGGYRVQGRDVATASEILEDARVLVEAGARLLVLECIPATLARAVTASVAIPTIGIGAGPECDGQVLVLHDAIGVSSRYPRFCRDFLASGGSLREAIGQYVRAVKHRSFPGPQESVD